MRAILEFFLVRFLRIALRFRYKVTVKGLEKLTPKYLKNPGGVLFLPNHPAALVDPCLVTLAVWRHYPTRPLIVEYMYFMPVIHRIMKFLKAIPVPDFETSTNSLKRKRHEKVISEVIKSLKTGDNFLLYPAGRLKHTAIEAIGGASATHSIIQEAPEANVVLVRTKGLWGSSFSRALTGKVPPLLETIKKGIVHTLKNFLFFNPRRHVIIELTPAPSDFPYQASRLELNRWLEQWYNAPDGLTAQEGKSPGDSLVLVSYSRWKEELPTVYQPKESVEKPIEVEGVPEEIKHKVLAKITELTEIDPSAISSNASLAFDLGMDSLDISELSAFLQDQFETGPFPITELKTVDRVLGIASKKVEIEKEVVEEQSDLSQWIQSVPRFRTQIAHGETIPEVFLYNCERMGKAPAAADQRSGVLTFSRLKVAVIILAEYLRHLPGRYIGILLPASVGAYLSVLACQLAGKVPLMINWTIGPRHLESVRELSDVKVVLTSWAFLEKLDSVDLNGVDDLLVMLESIRREFSLLDKIRGFFRSKRGVQAILKTFGIDTMTKDDQAVLLFTSGTEGMPKGVPLSHHNLLSNQRAAFDVIDLYSDDIMFGILPPFHAYGFSTSGLMGLLSGIRIAFYPNPTDGIGLAHGFETWRVTIMSGAPTFIKIMINAAKAKQLQTMRLCVTGAEKAPPELFELMANIGKEQCLLEGYGITECSPVLTANRPGKPRKGVGSPLPGVELCVVHPETHERLPVQTEGLILARGPNIFSGYLNPGFAPPFLTVEGKEWYNTGDIGFLDDETRLTISGRKKRFVKIGGEMISLLAIEEALLQSAPQKGWNILEEGPSLAVIAQDRPGEKPEFVLISVFDTGVDEVNQTLRDSGVSLLIKISRVIKTEEIPVMGTGKIHYRLLEEKYF
ncbi:MAG: AMP-binding protein [Waddliaceae bacterium]